MGCREIPVLHLLGRGFDELEAAARVPQRRLAEAEDGVDARALPLAPRAVCLRPDLEPVVRRRVRAVHQLVVFRSSPIAFLHQRPRLVAELDPEPAVLRIRVHGPKCRVSPMAVSAPDRLYFTGYDEADRLLVERPVRAARWASRSTSRCRCRRRSWGPSCSSERLGTLDAAPPSRPPTSTPIFRERPAIHRFPGAMAERVHELAVYVIERYDGDAARVGRTRRPPTSCARDVAELPGFGEMKIKALGRSWPSASGSRLAEPADPPGTRRSATSTPPPR